MSCSYGLGGRTSGSRRMDEGVGRYKKKHLRRTETVFERNGTCLNNMSLGRGDKCRHYCHGNGTASMRGLQPGVEARA